MKADFSDSSIDTIIKFVAFSLISMIFLGGLTIISDRFIGERIPTEIVNFGISIFILLSSLLIVKISKYFLFLSTDEQRNLLTEHQRELTYRFIQITVYLSAAFIIIVPTWGIDLSNILLGAGVLGIIGGLAARQALSSVFSGIIIMTTNMFKVQEWIKFENTFGVVRKITFFNTHIISPQREKHIIPNKKLTSEKVTNLSQQRYYRNDLLISVDYESDIDEVIDICDDEIENAQKDEMNLIKAKGQTSIKSFEDSGVIISVKFMIEDPKPFNINKSQTVIYKRLKKRFEKEGISIPYPHRTIVNKNEEESTHINT